ncbi:reverse transcriptase domain-containing protein [Tanacetum coccineum]
MRTRNSNFPNNSNVTIPRRRNKGRAPNIVEPELRTIVAPMAERTMEELLRAPTEGYGEAIVLPEINADHFEIKTNLLQLVQANPFHGLENENPHAHINSFKRITSTLRFTTIIIKSSICLFKSESKLKRGFNFTSRWGNDLGDHIYPVRKTIPRTNKERDNRNNNKTEVCRNFGRGVCRWGATCRGLDLAAQQQLLSLLQAQNTLLAQYGLSTISIPRNPIGFNNSGQRIVPAQPSAQQLMTHGLTSNQQALFTNAVQNTGNTSSNTDQETVLPTAFNTMTLQDPVNANWHMDTGASSHLNSSAHNLSIIFNSRMYPSVLVGDGKSIPSPTRAIARYLLHTAHFT